LSEGKYYSVIEARHKLLAESGIAGGVMDWAM
jgi:hypothetical protein